jgi:hypothetical protein
VNFSIYDNRSGQVLRTGYVSKWEDVGGQVRAGHEEVLRGVRIDPQAGYVVDDAEAPRPALDLPSVVALPPGAEPVAALSGLPEGTVVEMRGEPVPVVDGAALMVPAETDLVVTPPFPWRAAGVRVVLEP